ncbi:TPA: hypothetical protein ACF61V_001516 [Salmonella enterica]|uniref:hypothetical protein n=1 Tax=Salmonella enterica TaxID=28901 RepID=UPI000DCAAAFC|nr:hypothetical protein [Salmonella enterica]EBM9420059.1 hypothetical protein [Salmonella enterica subsp. enterica serovar Montevideo]EBP3980168.1 hypothetical protein [Salmonella enterica subsp. enterica]ATT70918.1 hypothetical protein AW68_15665 [Salmonella enterica subsp. enterica serovar Montevideo str. USDA-ARS-USMARC-1904]EAM3168432.1 hypothetical protein [Salmonella enterica]EAN3230760.1 hypothetical protein [Salmonella enterica]
MINRIMPEMLLNPRFIAVLNRCIDEEELIIQFERLSGVSRPPKRQHPVELMADKATGFYDEQWKLFFEAFIPFVYEFIWLTWEYRDNEEYWQ